jgi:hypothetical protein
MHDATETSRRKDLDKEMSSYISFLRKKEKKGISAIFKGLKGKKKKSSADLHPEVEAYGGEKHKKSKEEAEKEEKDMEMEYEKEPKPRTFWGWLKGRLVFEKEHDESLEDAAEEQMEETARKESQEIEEEIEEEYQEEVEKEGWFTSLMNKVFVKSREEEELEEVSDELAEDVQDMKAIAEITTNVMKMLPPEKMKELKEGEDFQQFKEILKKRNLIK